MNVDMQPELLEAQPDYIKDLHRRLQMEYRRAGIRGGAPTDTLGLGIGLEAGGPRSRRLEAPDPMPGPGRDLDPRWPREGSPDEGAGGCQVRRFPSPCAKIVSAAAAAAGPVPKVPLIATKPLADAVGVEATPRSTPAVAKEVMRLRLMKRQYDDLRAQLTRAETQLRRLPPTAISQFLAYLEKNLGDPELAVHVQEAIANLIECLCAVCKVELASATPESLLSSSRRLLRDPHSFAKKLCAMPPRSSAEAEGLAPFLLSDVQYRKVRDKEVNASFEALHSWLTAFYFFSAVSDQVSPIEEELERQEARLRRLEGCPQEDPPPSGRISTHATSPRTRTRGGFQGSPGAKSRMPLHGARGESARSPPPPAVGARGTAASGSGGAPASNHGQTSRGFGPRCAQSPGATSRSLRSLAEAAAAGHHASAGQPSAQLPRMQSLQSDALLTYLRARKKEGGPPPPGSGYSPQALPPEQLQQETRFQGGIHRRSSAPVLKEWEALRSCYD